ncbi:uncharacterized protein LOC125488671 [Plutella xylostella]|uniref:uncharacterized protein LOC125488671 n=1 Tax=Plutella xylostella TaxID=51655 RepID=UPI002032E2F0|nr:uncharacterized protein LOC125488671 [Plutella xylostella]
MTDQSRNAKKHDRETSLAPPRPSSPREFFARIYGHLEEPKNKSTIHEDSQNKSRTGGDVSAGGRECSSESSSDVEVEEPRGGEGREEAAWALPPPLPLCPRPMLLPHQQLAFGAGLAAFREYICYC